MLGVSQQALARAEARAGAAARHARSRRASASRAAAANTPGSGQDAACDASRQPRRLQVRRLRGSVPRVARGDPRSGSRATLPYFDAARADVLDVGCGRGEFLDLLAAHGIAARGIDLNHEMAEVCRARGLDVTEADAVATCRRLPDASLGGICSPRRSSNICEPGYLLRFLELAFHKLRPGGRHRARDAEPGVLGGVLRKLHPRHHTRLAAAPRNAEVPGAGQRLHPRGRSSTDRRSPPAGSPASRSRVRGHADARLARRREAFNANVEKLNARLFTHLDYAVIGGR